MVLPTGEFRDSIDALGYRPDRHRAFATGLLDEAEDDMLQSIVTAAAQQLSAPIALVNLVLEEIQFFKAHYGLPLDLATARSTERDVSFCQFVVRDGALFKVTNAKQDARVPQHLVKHYGIKSYLGIPLQVNDVIVGSLCVIDTEPRDFLEADHQILQELAGQVNERLSELSQRQRATHSIMVNESAGSALEEIRKMLSVIQKGATEGQLTMAALASFFRLMEHTIQGKYSPPSHLERSLKAAQEALEKCEDNYYNINANAGDAEDIRHALENGLVPSSATHLAEVARSGWELARQHTQQVGGAQWPEFSFNSSIATPRPLAVVLVSNCLSSIAARMAALDFRGGIGIKVEDLGKQVGLCIGTKELPSEAFQDIASKLEFFTRDNPSVVIQATRNAIRLLFAVSMAT